MLHRLVLAVAAGFALAMASVPVRAQDELQDGPKSLVISYRASLTHRAAFRRYLVDNLAPRLRAMKARHEIEDFRIFYSWYRQPAVWDGLVILRFPTFGAVTRWNALERTSPGGLDAAGQALGDPVATYSTDLAWSHNADTLRDGEVFYVIPYEYRNEGEYRDYVKGYVLPQFEGWIKTGAIDGYELYMNRFGTGLPWDSLFIQHYHDMSAFGRREQTTTSVRATLHDNAEWMAWSAKKAGIRTESENSIAELIAH